MSERVNRFIGMLVLAALTGCGGGGGTDSGATCPSAQTLSYESFGRDFMERYCARCHSGGASRGDGLALDSLAAVQAHRGAIAATTAAGPGGVNTEMPEGSLQPSRQERERLGEWLACGAP